VGAAHDVDGLQGAVLLEGLQEGRGPRILHVPCPQMSIMVHHQTRLLVRLLTCWFDTLNLMHDWPSYRVL
jgi:hypothetical protein